MEKELDEKSKSSSVKSIFLAPKEKGKPKVKIMHKEIRVAI